MNRQISVDFNRMIDRRLVHKEAVSEVLITEIRDLGGGLQIVGAQWPTHHAVYINPFIELDWLLIFETFRQSVLAAAHSCLGVPFDHAFVIDDVFVHLVCSKLRGPIRPANITIEMEMTARRGDDSSVRSIAASARLFSESQTVASTSGSARVISPAAYERLRPISMPLARLAADTVERNGLIKKISSETAEVLIDRNNTFYFDHVRDHVPAVVLASATAEFLQRSYPGARIRGAHFQFNSMCELSRPITLKLDDHGPRAVVTVESAGQVNLVADVDLVEMPFEVG